MPRRKIAGGNASAANVAPATGFAAYTGPEGATHCLLKQLAIVQTKAKNDSFRFVCEVREPSGSSRATYNGQSAWGRQTITLEGASFVNGMFAGLGLAKEDIASFWKDGPNLEKPDAKGAEKVLSIGKTKIDPEGMPVLVNLGMSESYTNPDTGRESVARIEVKSFLVRGADPEPEVGDDDYEDAELDDATLPADSDPENEEEGDEESEEEAAEEEGDGFDARCDELEGLKNDRPALVSIAGKNGHGLKVLKKHTNENLIEMILATEFPDSETTEGDEESEEEEAAPAPDPDPDPEPAPAAARSLRTSRTKPPAKAAKTAAAVPAANDDDEPPF